MKTQLVVGEVFTVSKATLGLKPNRIYVVTKNPPCHQDWPGHEVVAQELVAGDELKGKEVRFHQKTNCYTDAINDNLVRVVGKVKFVTKVVRVGDFNILTDLKA